MNPGVSHSEITGNRKRLGQTQEVGRLVGRLGIDGAAEMVTCCWPTAHMPRPRRETNAVTIPTP